MTASVPEARFQPHLIAFWFLVGALIALKFGLISDISVEIIYGPHDDSLYVERAYHLLQGEGYGPYDSRLLIKYPGISFWLAGTRLLGIPFLPSIHVLYVAAGLYILIGFLRAGMGRWLALSGFALWLFNPVTLGYEWARVIREPLGAGLYAVLAGAMLHVFVGISERRAPWLHLGVFASVFTFVLYLREDDQLLWGMLVLFVAAMASQLHQRRPMSRRLLAFVVAGAVIPGVMGKTYEFWLRGFVHERYGLPIVNDFGEGEFPRLMAAIRSVDSKKDNRLVMVTQEALEKLHLAIPDFRPVIERLPPPGPRSFSCRIQGVCSEWANGWMPFWIKEQAYRAGLTPGLPQAQAYFRSVREQIEHACGIQALQCTRKGDAMIPPMELRWTRALVAEAWRLGKLTLVPDPYLTRIFYLQYGVPAELGRKFEAVTMTDYAEAEPGPADAKEASGSLALWRKYLAAGYQVVALFLLIAGVTALALRLWISDRMPLDPVARVAVVVGIYLLARLAILSYVTVFMGPLEPRFVFSTYTLGTLMSLPLIANTLSVLSQMKRP